MLSRFKSFFNNFKEYIILTILLLISLSVISLNRSPAVTGIKRISIALFGAGFSLTENVSDWFRNDDELQNLREMNGSLMLQLALREGFKTENRELKNLLGFRDSSNIPLIPATVISRMVSGPGGTIIINAGLEEGIEKGMPVLNEKGLLGIVSETTRHYSAVSTLTNPGLRVAVKNQRSLVNGILEWNGTRPILKDIPVNYDLQPGDSLVTSEFSTIVPHEIPVGIVQNADTRISGLLSNYNVALLANPEKVKHLFVYKVIRSIEIDSLEMNLLRDN